MSSTLQDLEKPLYSGLAAALYVENVLKSQPHPVDISQQADFWANSYHTGGAPAVYTSLANLMDTGQSKINDTCLLLIMLIYKSNLKLNWTFHKTNSKCQSEHKAQLDKSMSETITECRA